MYHVFAYRRTKLSKHLIISPTGEYAFCGDSDIAALEARSPLPEELYMELKTKHFLCDDDEVVEEELIQSVRRHTKQAYLESMSILLMVVPTIECNCECVYCQASSRKSHSRSNYMGFKTIYAFCLFALSLPHKDIKIEFQGGEPTLHTAAIQFIVKFLEKHKDERGKSVSYVICTNLLELDSQLVELIVRYRIDISTSLDGGRELHEHNRPSPRFASTYDALWENLSRLREYGVYPSALLTITRYNIGQIEKVIDEYIALGFRSVFIRQLNNYGYAFRNRSIQYSNEEFMGCYTEGVKYIIRKNLGNGVRIREEWFSILLKKVMSPFLDGFVDIQNPTALARMCLLVNHDGNIYPSDEARMIAEMGDGRFLLGNLAEHLRYDAMLARSSDFSHLYALDELPQCRACPYMPYCGADPVRNYYVATVSGESFCGKKKCMFDFLFTRIEEASGPELRLFRSWANG
jgi:His-Xaa-Ser repeat-associated upstream radical SAM protein